MRKLYNELFYIPKHAKVSDKNMLARIALSVSIAVACLIAMGFSAYAYFSCSVTSASNVIKGANFDATVSVVSEATGEDVVLQTENGLQKVTLTAGTYTVNISKADTSTAQTGFCIITINGVDYHTRQLGSVSFTLTVPDSTELTLRCHWGTSSYYGYDNADSNPNYITGDRTIEIAAVYAEQPDNSKEENENVEPA